MSGSLRRTLSYPERQGGLSQEDAKKPSVETQSAGPLADQAALDGLLRRVCDLGMPLLSVDLCGRPW